MENLEQLTPIAGGIYESNREREVKRLKGSDGVHCCESTVTEHFEESFKF